ncbi:MAG: V-type ATP synthase subunit I [Nitrososphaerales archaeon]
MLKPAAMQRVAVVGSRDERARVVSILYEIGVLQIEPLSSSAAPLLKTGTDSLNTKEVSEELLRVRSLLAALPPVPVREKRGFASFGEVLDAAKAIDIDARVSSLKQEEERLRQRLDELNGRIDLVTKLSFVGEDLGVFDLASAASFFGTVSPAAQQELTASLSSSIPDAMTYSSGTDPVSMIVVVPNEALESFGSMIQKGDLRLQRIPPMKGRPAEVLAALGDEKRAAEARLAALGGELGEISEKNYATLSSLEEQLAIEARKLEVVNNFGFTESSFVVEGWVPVDKMGSLEGALSRFSKATAVFKIEGEEKPPTLLENPKRLRYFESFIRFYASPQQNEIDPSMIFAAAFPIFFGLMLGDVGYAVLIILISVWIIRRVNNPGGKTLVPAALRTFASRILKPVQFRKLARAMILGSVVGIVVGFLLNEYFGFHENQYLFTWLNANLHTGLPADGTFLDPLSTKGLKTLLLDSGYIGLFMVSFGLVLGMLNAYWMKERKHLIGKVGWLAVAWGLALFGLTLFRHGNVNPAQNPLAGGYIGGAVIGIVLIIYGEGTLAIIELPSIVSHIISYTRLLGILLASVVLALVIDNQAVGSSSAPGLVYGGVGLAIAGVVLLVVGHAFNLVLGILEPGIQGARLIYVEHFSKYLHGGGRQFTPFRGSRTHTLSETELMKEETGA